MVYSALLPLMHTPRLPVASTLHTTSEHGLSSITTADAHNSAASSRLNWRPRQFKWTRLFLRKTKSGFCACAITFQTQCNIYMLCILHLLVWFINCTRWPVHTSKYIKLFRSSLRNRQYIVNLLVRIINVKYFPWTLRRLRQQRYLQWCWSFAVYQSN